jgi:hypothetical protein
MMQRRWTAVRAALAPAGVALALVLAAGGQGLSASAAASEQTLWGSGSPSGVRTADDSSSVELGTAFTVEDTGTISGVRYWRSSDQPDTQAGALWTAGGQLVASASASSDQSGWQTARFAAPVKVDAGDSFVVSYHAPQGGYAFTADYHGSAVSSGLSIPSSNAGRFTYASSTRFPTHSYRSTSYWVTPVFTPADSDGSGGVAPAPAPAPAPTTAPASGKPGPSNTGVPAGTTLTSYTGPHTITEAGTVIDSKDVRGALVIKAKNVVIRNSKIHDDPQADAGIYVTGSGSATITDSEIYNFPVGITYSNFTAIRVDLHDITFDGLKMSSDARLQDSWIHDAQPTSDAHWDGVQVQNGVTNTVIQGNNIDASGANTNTALFLTPDLGPTTDGPLTVTGNWLDGGNFTVAILDGNDGEYYIRKISVTNNRFGRDNRYGPANVNVPVTWSGNVWDDTGKGFSL